VRGADIVLMVMPYAEVEATYSYIAQDLRPGVVIIDFSGLKSPSLAWASKHLGSEAHMIGALPLINHAYMFSGVERTELASADFFDNGLFLLTPSTTCVPEAIRLAEDLAEILGAGTQFVDPAENDSLVAATENLPALLGMAYFHTMRISQGWEDVSRLTNPDFAMLTHQLYDTHPDDLRDQWMQNRENLVRYTDQLIATLRELRGVLASRDQDALEAVLSDNTRAYEVWYNRRVKNRWKADDRKLDLPDSSPGSAIFGTLIPRGLRRNRGKEDES
jgi:prephenate dehydrogenase